MSREPHPDLPGELVTYDDGTQVRVWQEFDRGTERMELLSEEVAP